METTKNQPAPRGQRQFRVDDPKLQPAYKLAYDHAQKQGRNFLLYRDFQTGYDEFSDSGVTLGNMRAARRHFRVARVHPEGPDPSNGLEFYEFLVRNDLLFRKDTKTVFGKKIKGDFSHIPKRYRKI